MATQIPPFQNSPRYTRFQHLFLALTGLFASLAMVSRPNLIPPLFLFLLLLALITPLKTSEGKAGWGKRLKPRAKTLALLLLSTSPILSLQGLYNYQRFDNPLEFGISYQLGALDNTRALKPNRLDPEERKRFLTALHTYLFHPPHWEDRFPYILYSPPPQEALHKKLHNGEPAVGLTYSSPALLLSLIPLGVLIPLLLLDLRRTQKLQNLQQTQTTNPLPHPLPNPAIPLLGLLSLTTCLTTMFTLCLVPFLNQRYLIDPTPFLAFGALVLCKSYPPIPLFLQTPWIGTLARWSIKPLFLALLIALTLVFGVLPGFRGNFAEFYYINPKLFKHLQETLPKLPL